MFKAAIQDLMREELGLALKRDVLDELGKQEEAWKGIRLIEAETVAG